MTVPELHQAVMNSFTPTPETEDVEVVYDISDWLLPHIVNVRNHTYPHTYKFFLNEQGKAVMNYKNWATDQVWQPEEEPIRILESLPEGLPSVIQPGLGGKETIKIEDLNSKIAGSCHRMTNEQLQWWKQFVIDETALRKKWENITEEEKKELAATYWPLTNLRKCDAMEERKAQLTDEEKRQEEELNRLLQKEKNFPPVRIRKYTFLEE